MMRLNRAVGLERRSLALHTRCLRAGRVGRAAIPIAALAHRDRRGRWASAALRLDPPYTLPACATQPLGGSRIS